VSPGDAAFTLAARCDTPADTQALAGAVAGVCRAGDVLLLVGGLGAGKTTFAQGFAAALGVEGPVTSPTFTLVRQYPCRGPGGIESLLHADVYRLDRLAEVADLALDELVEQAAVALVEWGEAAAPVLGDETLPPRAGPRRPAVHRGGVMRLLAIETATELVGAAVSDDDGVRAAAWVVGRRRHAELLAPLVDDVLARAGVVTAELTAVAVDVGPGLFTGLRVGVAMAKGLAFAAGVGVVPVTSLAVLATEATEARPAGDVLAVIDARRAEVFVARYGPATTGHPGVPVVRHEPRRCRPEDLTADLPALAASSPGGLLVVGDGAARYAGAEGWDRVTGVSVAGPALRWPPPAAAAALAARLVADGYEPLDPVAVAADYRREADARINWVTRRRAPGPGSPAEGTGG
jgi:tRNA threonylcarbamoyl adenosine modification protein YeaZ/tRNA threonylcarbamoyl adenosine modification protein YjeE